MLAKRKDRWADSDSDDGGAGSKPKPTKVPKEAKSKKKVGKPAADAPAAAAAVSTPAVAAKPAYVPVLHGCRSVECYERLNHIDEGTYGVVFRGRDKETGDVYALKQVKLSSNAGVEGFPITALREINILMSLRHENIVRVREVVVGSSADKVYMVMEFMEHDLRSYLDNLREPLSLAEIKCVVRQLLSALAYMHERWVMHRDLKTPNILIGNDGRACICDFGLARHYGSPVRKYTQNVVTRWYRCPELLLGSPVYSTGCDVWAMGCIFGELLSNKPLFAGTDEAHQLDAIFYLLGSPSKKTWPDVMSLPLAPTFKWKTYSGGKLRDHMGLPARPFSGVWLSESGLDLLTRMLSCDPAQRISAQDALNHPWFEEAPKPALASDLPKFPSANEGPAPSSAPAAAGVPDVANADQAARPIAPKPTATPEDAWRGLFAEHVPLEG